MIQDRKIDLALEAKELAEGSAAQTTRLAGVKAQEDTVFGYPLTRVEILNREGEAALGKPKGTYLTLELPQLPREREEVLRAARGVAAVLEALPTLPKQGSVLVAGLGNRRVTPDAIGPRATDFLLVTRHLVEQAPEHFGTLIKRRGALLAKGRLLGVQFDALFTDDLYLRISRNAIAMAQRLKEGLKAKGYPLYMENPTNQIFVILDEAQRSRLSQQVSFSFWETLPDGRTVVRFATSWATTAENVDTLIDLL